MGRVVLHAEPLFIPAGKSGSAEWTMNRMRLTNDARSDWHPGRAVVLPHADCDARAETAEHA